MSAPYITITSLLSPLFLVSACSDANFPDEDLAEGWSIESHSNDADPDYDIVFPSNTVQRLDIFISSENYNSMQDEMTTLQGEFGVGG
ncbi:MAG: spore coat protein CotH, partial [Proteobacteria bacterium]|nr:spore coat protein CotH [Pseudomonadota bacterium]